MQERLISFETAQLAKDKGFIHMKANCYGDNMCYQLPEGALINALQGNTVLGYILAPTQALLQKWLREEHDIFVHVEKCWTGDTLELKIFKRSKSGKYQNVCRGEKFGTSYEELLEIGLMKTLKFIK